MCYAADLITLVLVVALASKNGGGSGKRKFWEKWGKMYEVCKHELFLLFLCQNGQVWTRFTCNYLKGKNIFLFRGECPMPPCGNTTAVIFQLFQIWLINHLTLNLLLFIAIHAPYCTTSAPIGLFKQVLKLKLDN